MSGSSLVAVDVSSVPASLTGVGRYAVGFLGEAVKSAPDAGVELLAIAKRGDEQRFGRLCPGLRVAGEVPAPRPARIAFERLAMARTVERHGAALYHGIHYTLPGGLRIKTVATIHDMTFLEHPEWHQRSKVVFFRRMIAASAARADGLVFPSRSALEAFRRHFDTKARTVVISHGVAPARFVAPEGAGDDDIIAPLGVRRPYFLFCGTLEPRKNLERLLDAFLSLETSEVELVIAGLVGWKDSGLRPKLERLEASGRGRLVGFVGDLQLGALYRRAVATVYPSLEEGFGLPGLEAMSQGSLLITSAHSAMAEYAGEDCLLVDPHDVSSIAAALAEAIEGGGSLAAKAEAGRSRAAAMTWRASAQGHLELYRSILGL
ncbi:MAG: glycosyltransferase family 1 protein [Nitrospiraceae bacterium]|nr:glycosyltransferase family 1 protein [Nitrospiraceae bacterium]MDA8262050.1 glycosyltransferase family 1 protein [Actinomycetota bacterium]